MIYLDNAASTRPYDAVVDAVADVMKRYMANPSALHQGGFEAAKLLRYAREKAAELLGVMPEEVIFTSGGTESNNMALKGIALRYKNRGRHIITSAVEHSSVSRAVDQLEEMGFEVTRLPVDGEGRVSVSDLERALRKDTILVSIMLVNNETGAVQPVAEIGQLLRKRRDVYFHVDAVQAFGKLPVHFGPWGIDLMSLSAHKFHGPRGVGLLVKRQGTQLWPLMAGGGQEGGWRPGTENLPAIVGMVTAMQQVEEDRKKKVQHLAQLKERLRDGILQLYPKAFLVGGKGTAPHILNVCFPHMKGEVLLHALEEKGVLVSTKAACSSKKEEPSAILLAMGIPAHVAQGSIRFGLSYLTTEQDIEGALFALGQALEELSPVMEGGA